MSREFWAHKTWHTHAIHFPCVAHVVWDMSHVSPTPIPNIFYHVTYMTYHTCDTSYMSFIACDRHRMPFKCHTPHVSCTYHTFDTYVILSRLLHRLRACHALVAPTMLCHIIPHVNCHALPMWHIISNDTFKCQILCQVSHASPMYHELCTCVWHTFHGDVTPYLLHFFLSIELVNILSVPPILSPQNSSPTNFPLTHHIPPSLFPFSPLSCPFLPHDPVCVTLGLPFDLIPSSPLHPY